MIGFWTIVTALLAAALLYVAVSARRARPRLDTTTPEHVFRQRTAELARDVESGQLDAAQAAAVSAELARQALRETPSAPTLRYPQGRRPALLVMSALLPLIAIPLYFVLGSPALLAPSADSGPERLSLEQIVGELQKRIDTRPDDPEPRLWMARVMVAAERYAPAVEQYAKIVELVGERPEILVQYADALAMLNGGRMVGRPRELVERALQLDPDDPSALWLAGLAAHETGELPRARELLVKARAAAAAAHRPTAELDAQIAALDAAPEPAAPGPRLEITVDVSPELRDKVAAGATLFVLARRSDAAPLPLAVRRMPARGFPLRVTLDDGAAVTPQATLGTAAEVEVVARISRSGDAGAVSGDLEGRRPGVRVSGVQRIDLTIDRVLP